MRYILWFLILFAVACSPGPRCPGSEPKQMTVEIIQVTFEGDDRQVPIAGMPEYIEKYFKEASLGQLEMHVRTSGPFKIHDGGGCYPHEWAETLQGHISDADRIVFIWPTRFDCQFGGFTYLYNKYSWVNSKRPSVVTHELGHTLGLEHASTVEDEYGDDTDCMGDGPGLFSGYHMYRLGWTHPVVATTTGTYEIATIGTSSMLPHVIKVPIGFSDAALYIDARYAHGDFEKKTGVFARLGNNSGLNFVLDQKPETLTIDPITNLFQLDGITVKVEKLTPDSAIISVTVNK